MLQKIKSFFYWSFFFTILTSVLVLGLFFFMPDEHTYNTYHGDFIYQSIKILCGTAYLITLLMQLGQKTSSKLKQYEKDQYLLIGASLLIIEILFLSAILPEF